MPNQDLHYTSEISIYFMLIHSFLHRILQRGGEFSIHVVSMHLQGKSFTHTASCDAVQVYHVVCLSCYSDNNYEIAT